MTCNAKTFFHQYKLTMQTRMHSSRMRTVHQISYGGFCPRGLCLAGSLFRGSLSREVSIGGLCPGGLCSGEGGLCPRETLSRGSLIETPLDRDHPGHVTFDACWDRDPPMNRITNRCKNITFPRFRCGW